MLTDSLDTVAPAAVPLSSSPSSLERYYNLYLGYIRVTPHFQKQRAPSVVKEALLVDEECVLLAHTNTQVPPTFPMAGCDDGRTVR